MFIEKILYKGNIYPEESNLSKCINCGFCKTKCTQHLDIPNILRNIAKEYRDIKKNNILY